jgi:hypothetical protein
MVDIDGHTVTTYRVTGWQGTKITLSSINEKEQLVQLMPRSRVVYELAVNQFKVTREQYEGGHSHAYPGVTCGRTKSDTTHPLAK